MKVSSSLFFAFAFTVVAHAQLPAGSSITYAPGTAANTSRLTIIDPGDHVWCLQSPPTS